MDKANKILTLIAIFGLGISLIIMHINLYQIATQLELVIETQESIMEIFKLIMEREQ